MCLTSNADSSRAIAQVPESRQRFRRCWKVTAFPLLGRWFAVVLCTMTTTTPQSVLPVCGLQFRVFVVVARQKETIMSYLMTKPTQSANTLTKKVPTDTFALQPR